MGCTQTNIFLPNVGLILRVPNARPGNQHFLSQSSYLHVSPFCSSATHRFLYHKALRSVASESKYKRCAPVCSFGGKGNSGSGGEDFSWDSLKKAMEGLGKQSSLENRLKKEIEQRQFDGDGGGKNPPGDGGDGSGGPEDEGFSAVVEEFLQVIMATISFILVDLKTKQVLGGGRESNGLYYLDVPPDASTAARGLLTSTDDWHRRLGYPPLSVMQSMYTDESFSVFQYESCMMSKHVRSSHPVVN